MTPTKWSNTTNAIGFRTRSGKYGGGTFAHRDIVLEFAAWISPEVRLYIIKEFQRLKAQESEQLEWQGKSKGEWWEANRQKPFLQRVDPNQKQCTEVG